MCENAVNSHFSCLLLTANYLLLKPLLNCIDVIPCSSSECERGFSQMNIILDERSSKLTIKHVSSLMFIKRNGPPLAVWNPIDYTKSWLKYHSSAVDNRVLKVKNSETNIKNDI